MELNIPNSVDNSSELNQEKSSEFNISKQREKVEIYKNILETMLVKIKIIKDILDYYHLKLHKKNVKIKSSSNFFSATTLLNQSLLPSSYPNLQNSGNVYGFGVSEYLKIELKENIVSDLKNKFEEFINRINHNLELLRPWENKDYYKENDFNDFIKKLDEEYSYIISVRKDLYQEYEYIMPYKIAKKFNKKYIKKYNKI